MTIFVSVEVSPLESVGWDSFWQARPTPRTPPGAKAVAQASAAGTELSISLVNPCKYMILHIIGWSLPYDLS